MPRQPCDIADAAICAARVGDTSDNVGDVAMDADSVTAPRGLHEADREAYEEVCASSNLTEHEPLRFDGRVIGGDLPI